MFGDIIKVSHTALPIMRYLYVLLYRYFSNESLGRLSVKNKRISFSLEF